MKTKPTEREILKVLQYLSDLKIDSYRSKRSKNSDYNIEILKNSYEDVSKLIKYFTKR